MILFDPAVITGYGDRYSLEASAVTLTIFGLCRAAIVPEQILCGRGRNSAKHTIIWLTAIFLQNFQRRLFGKLIIDLSHGDFPPFSIGMHMTVRRKISHDINKKPRYDSRLVVVTKMERDRGNLFVIASDT